MSKKLKKGDLFLVVEKQDLESGEYEETWPEEKEDNLYTNIMEENGLKHCFELPKLYWIYGPIRVYTAKKIPVEQAYKWYEVSVYYQEGPESSEANARSLIECKAPYFLYEVRKPNEQLIY
jgi:hypothetical protein